ncbi:MAG: molybdopterin-dependent oxidoreductase, partial [Caldilinea sp.]
LLWRVEPRVQTALALPGAERRFTGSYETGSFTGRFPQVIWLFDNPATVDPAHWRLEIIGAVERPLLLSLDDLAPLVDTTQAALLDCTGGWHSTQEWTGVPLSVLLERARPVAEARSVTVESVTGYARRFALDELQGYLLATRVAGTTLAHGHGFPLRLVAPDRRGFEWVKWVTRVHVNTTSAHLQSPLPLQ